MQNHDVIIIALSIFGACMLFLNTFLITQRKKLVLDTSNTVKNLHNMSDSLIKSYAKVGKLLDISNQENANLAEQVALLEDESELRLRTIENLNNEILLMEETITGLLTVKNNCLTNHKSRASDDRLDTYEVPGRFKRATLGGNNEH